eukprot:119865-Pleurochrysis_carterae.AAC.1
MVAERGRFESNVARNQRSSIQKEMKYQRCAESNVNISCISFQDCDPTPRAMEDVIPTHRGASRPRRPQMPVAWAPLLLLMASGSVEAMLCNARQMSAMQHHASTLFAHQHALHSPEPLIAQPSTTSRHRDAKLLLQRQRHHHQQQWRGVQLQGTLRRGQACKLASPRALPPRLALPVSPELGSILQTAADAIEKGSLERVTIHVQHASLNFCSSP